MKRSRTITRSKYGAVRTNGYHSKGEAKRAAQLGLLAKAGAIQDLRKQVPFVLQDGFRRDGKAIRAITYIMDFVYMEKGKLIAEDFKGFATADNKIKQKMFMYRYPEYTLRITK